MILNKLVDKTKSETEKLHLVMAACTIVHCADGVPKSDPRYEDLISEQSQGSKYTTEINQLKAAGFGGYTKLDGISDAVTRNSAIFPSATSNIEGQLVINSFRANAPSAKVQTEQYLVNQAKAVCGSGGNFQKCGNANQAIRNFAQANNGLSTAVANRYIQNVDNGVYNAMANETKSTSANVREAVNNVRQTGKEALDCATLKGCTTGGFVSVAGVVSDFMGAGIAVKGMSAEARLAAMEANNSLAEINQARIDNNFYVESNQFDDTAAKMQQAQTNNWTAPNGSPLYPPNNGAVVNTTFPTTLPVGTKLDRYGAIKSGSDFLAPAGTPYGQRALPAGADSQPLVQLEVVKPLPVQKSNVMPWFGQEGRGIQYQTTTGNTGWTIQKLIKEGFLKVVK